MKHKDSLGDRIKDHYEGRTRFLLPRRTYTIIRVDGKAFHTYTRGCDRPYDVPLMEDMDRTAVALCQQIAGAQLAFVQSDEISILLTDFASSGTEAWFDGSLQKLVSLSASIATAHFNSFRAERADPFEEASPPQALAYFDSRAFTIPDPVEVENYFVWRQQDATRNSISMTAQAHFPHDLLQGKTSDEMQELLWQGKGLNWNDMPGGFKRGRCIVIEPVVQDKEYMDHRTGETRTAQGVERHTWVPVTPPVFTQDRSWLQSHIPHQRSL